MSKCYALYKGEELLHIGTLTEIAEKEGVKQETIKFYSYPTYKKRGKSENRRTVVCLDE